MGFMNKVFSAFGFESEGEVKQSKKPEHKKAKASYKLKKNENVKKIDNINGIKVFYPSALEDCKSILSMFKDGEPVIINTDYADKDEKEPIISYFTGACDITGGKICTLEDERYYILLPEGMEIEE